MSKNQLSQEELLALPVTVDIVTAGRAFGISRDTSYELLRRGEFPCRTLKVGRLRRVPRAEILRALGVDDSTITQASA